MKSKERWVVEWCPRDAVAMELAKRAKEDGVTLEDYAEFHGIADAAIEVMQCAYFQKREAAIAHAKSVAPLDECGEVRVWRETARIIDFHDGTFGTDWEADERNPEYVFN